MSCPHCEQVKKGREEQVSHGSCCCCGHHGGGKSHVKSCCGGSRGDGEQSARKEIAFLLISLASLVVGFALSKSDVHLPAFPLTDPSWIAVILCGVPLFRAAKESLFEEKKITSSLLVSIAITAAIALQFFVYFGGSEGAGHSHDSYIFAAGEISQSHLLTMRASRMGFFLLLFVALPAWLLMPFVLELWLKTVPDHTLAFVRLILVQLLTDSFSYPLMTLAQASGRVALYQAVVGGTLWLTLPCAWIALKFFNLPPESVAVVSIGISLVCLWLRLILIRRCAGLSIRAFAKNTIAPALVAACVAAVVPAIVAFKILPTSGWAQFFAVGFASVFCTVFAVVFLGFRRDERAAVANFLRTKIPFLKK